MLTRQSMPIGTIRRIISRYDVGEIRNAESLATSGNIAYIVTATSGQYFLRLSPDGPRWRSANEITTETRFLTHLADHRFPVLRPLKMRNGESVIAWRGHYGYLRQFIHAHARMNPSLMQIRMFGRTVGQLHALATRFRPPHPREHIFDLAATRAHFHVHRSRILASTFPNRAAFVERFEREISQLHFPATLPHGMIHEDLGKRHVLWRGNAISAIVDFDRSYVAPFVLDLGQAMRGWCFTRHWRSWSHRRFRALLTGYVSTHPLMEIEQRSLVDAIVFGVLERALAYCLRYIIVTHDSADAAFADELLSVHCDFLARNRERMELMIARLS